jgi:hypothetical protein
MNPYQNLAWDTSHVRALFPPCCFATIQPITNLEDSLKTKLLTEILCFLMGYSFACYLLIKQIKKVLLLLAFSGLPLYPHWRCSCKRHWNDYFSMRDIIFITDSMVMQELDISFVLWDNLAQKKKFSYALHTTGLESFLFFCIPRISFFLMHGTCFLLLCSKLLDEWITSHWQYGTSVGADPIQCFWIIFFW